MTLNKKLQGFTLVELSIIIIIGFLISGISAGQSLIKQAALTSVVTDFNNYKLAYTTFIGRYNQKPGDMNNAYSYWGLIVLIVQPIVMVTEMELLLYRVMKNR